MEYETILLQQDGGIAILTLNRPTHLNAFTLQMSEEFLDAVVRCYSNQNVKALVLTGAGEAFSAGGDVKAMAELLESDPSTFFRKLTTNLDGVVATLIRMPKPVIGAVNGVAAGAGFAMALACDLLVASAKARFKMAFTGIGLTPDCGVTYFLPRLIGVKRVVEMAWSNRELSADDALNMGIVNEVVAEADLLSRVRTVGAQLAQGPLAAIGRAKALIYEGLGDHLETQMERERNAIADSSLTADFREGILAFQARRHPKFIGN
ncbi:MAG: enoyl-CoA hydratase/isomerase family protein [Chloroflexi bacterium]|nr:enoyl-CoA hydratase/isomerase family protein [Chloroflexota bacterium]